MMAERQPTLGSHLRGSRLGFRWSELLRYYVRVSGIPGQWLIEVAPPRQIPSQKAPGGYRCWWERPSLESELCDILTRPAGDGARAVPKLDRLLRVTVDDNAHINLVVLEA